MYYMPNARRSERRQSVVSVSARTPSPAFNTSIVQTWKNECKPGFILDYDTLTCVSRDSKRGKALMSAERRAQEVLSSSTKTTRQKLFDILKIAGKGYLLYLLGRSAVSGKLRDFFRTAFIETGVRVVTFARQHKATPLAAPPKIAVNAKDSTKTMLKKTMHALLGTGIMGAALLAKLKQQQRRGSVEETNNFSFLTPPNVVTEESVRLAEKQLARSRALTEQMQRRQARRAETDRQAERIQERLARLKNNMAAVTPRLDTINRALEWNYTPVSK